jgi:hypothetical protein
MTFGPVGVCCHRTVVAEGARDDLVVVKEALQGLIELRVARLGYRLTDELFDMLLLLTDENDR